jgi:hypothetical protein
MKFVNKLYPSDLQLDDLPSRKDVVDTLLAELNRRRGIDE